MSYQLVYTREKHEALEGVRGKAAEGKFMVLGADNTGGPAGELGEEGGKRSGGGYTIGGDISFYEWDFAKNMPQKNTQEANLR